MGIHFNHKSKAGDRKMQKELKLKMKAEERKKKREERRRVALCMLLIDRSTQSTGTPQDLNKSKRDQF